jgi:arsenite oxidase small subunit
MNKPNQESCITRRNFMLLSGASVVTLASLGFPANGQTPEKALYKEYPRRLIGRVSELEVSVPKPFHYPHEHPFCRSLLFKLKTEAGGGVGPAKNIVAFNQLCTHMGGMLEGQFNSKHQVLGPCPIHLTTYDIVRHGMVVSGHSTQGLPQILLELEGDEIYAIGVLGLIYGYHDNLARIGEKD